ncbi:MAG TPA: DoxX family protein [Candidatus Acidoferrales bacterium]|nr:DoxX family protein [Candidatus Acidoferrales bacterium]
MTAAASGAGTSKGSLWTGRVISGLVVLFLLFDGVTKVIREPHVMEASARIGFSGQSVVAIGAVLLVCTLLYVIPRSSIFGAVLLTGYLGGAVATNVLAKTSAFNVSFPVIFGVLVWGGIFLRDPELRAIIPLRRPVR